jgi:hypothetical protein
MFPAAWQPALAAFQPWYMRVSQKVQSSLLATVLRACTREAAEPLAAMIAALPPQARLQQQPLPVPEVHWWQEVVDFVRANIGPLPITDWRLRRYPCQYLPWLHRCSLPLACACVLVLHVPKMQVAAARIGRMVPFAAFLPLKL